ncbi:hypothetical protein CGQ24_04335 [Arthrobacter sp. 7749]|nr:hypothetical protein CGQ24_04335 [Arthrobacter sp. 7749]
MLFAASGMTGTGQFFAGPVELAGIGFGVGLILGLGDVVGGELDAGAVGVEAVGVGSIGSALPTHPAAAKTNAAEQNMRLTFLIFVSMPTAYDSVGVD